MASLDDIFGSGSAAPTGASPALDNIFGDPKVNLSADNIFAAPGKSAPSGALASPLMVKSLKPVDTSSLFNNFKSTAPATPKVSAKSLPETSLSAPRSKSTDAWDNIMQGLHDHLFGESTDHDAVSSAVLSTLVDSQLLGIAKQLGVDQLVNGPQIVKDIKDPASTIPVPEKTPVEKQQADKAVIDYMRTHYNEIRNRLTDPSALPEHPDMLGPAFSEVSKNLADYTKQLGVRSTPTNMEIVGAALALPVAAGFVDAAIPTAIALGAFSAFSEIEHYFLGDTIAGKVSDSLGVNSGTEDVLNLVELFAEGKALHKLYVAAPDVATKFTKNIVVTYRPGTTISFSPEQIQAHFSGRTPDTILKDAGLTNTQIRDAFKNGVNIEVAPEKVIALVDKPYWAKLKSTLGMNPAGAEPVTVPLGKTKVGPESRASRLIGKGSEKLTAATDAMRADLKKSIATHGEDVTHQALQEHVGVDERTASELIQNSKASRTKAELKVAQSKLTGDILGARTDAQVKEAAIKHVADNQEKLIQSYVKEHGNYVGTDEAKEFLPGYKEDRSTSDLVQKGASQMSEAIYDHLLETRQDAGRGETKNTVLVTSGGTGSGKSTALRNSNINTKNFAVVYDSNSANFEAAKDRIDRALAKGFNVDMQYVHAPIDKAYDRVLDRSEQMGKTLGSGRPVSAQGHIDMHHGASATMARLMEHFKDDERVKFGVVDNGSTETKLVHPKKQIDFMRKIVDTKRDETELHKELNDQRTLAAHEGRISEKTNQAFERAEQLRPPKDRGVDGQKPEEPQSEDVLTKVRTLAKGVEELAIQKKLTETFGDLPEYETVSMKAQAEQASALLKSDYELAKQIAMGAAQPPEGLLPESVFIAVENKAILDGDVQTLRNLAVSSELTAEATLMGQRIRTLGERDGESPVKAIADVARIREKVAKGDVPRKKKAVVAKIKAEIEKGEPQADEWEQFISGITC